MESGKCNPRKEKKIFLDAVVKKKIDEHELNKSSHPLTKR